MKFLQSLDHSQDYAAWLIQQLIPCLKSDSLLEWDCLLSFVEKAVQGTDPASEDYKNEVELARKLTARNTEAMMEVLKDQTLTPAVLSGDIEQNKD